MIPTAHLRLYSDSVHKTPRLQQLWAPTMGDETLFYPAQFILDHGGEWRVVPLVIELASPGYSLSRAAIRKG